MSLLNANDKDLVDLVKFYSQIISRNREETLRQFYYRKRAIYTKELKARGISWRET